MLANNTSYEDSFTTCQITPENYGSLLGSLLNMQLASRNPFSGQFFFAKFTGPPLQHALWLSPALSHNFRGTFAELSRKYPYSQTPAISRGCTEGKAKTRGLGVWLSQSLTFGNLATATRILWCPSPAGPRAAVGGSPLDNDYNIQLSRNFREIKFYFRELEKKLSPGFPTWHPRLSQVKLLTRTFRSITIYI